ncbi:MAG: ribonuclease P protein component [Phycisphaerales bacterium]
MPEAAGHRAPTPAARLLFRRAQRLTKDREFQAVFAAKCTRQRGPLTIHGKLSGLRHTRLGLSVGKRVGNAVERNRVKRLLREAFRLSQRELPPGLDLIVSVRPHKDGTLEKYREALVSAAAGLAADLAKRAKGEA